MANRRDFIRLGVAAGAGALLAMGPGQSRAASMQGAMPLVDGLGFPGGISPEENAPLLPEEVADIARSGLCATHLTVGPVGTMPALQAFEQTVRELARREADIDRHPQVLARVRRGEDIQAALAAGRTGLIYGLQDGIAFQDDLDRLDTLHQLGVRIIQPTYNRRNLLGDGCMEPADAGLSRQGSAAIEKMNSLNILVDLSHSGRRTTADAMSTSARPVSFTHTGCDALAPHPRHRTDAEIRRVAEQGGVTGIFIMPYLARGRQPTAEDVILHLEHALKVGGEDHVAIGTDGSISPTAVTEEFKARFREITRKRREAGIAAPYETETGYLFASDLNAPDRFVTLADKLRRRGHPERVVAKVMGGNWLRFFRDSWLPA